MPNTLNELLELERDQLKQERSQIVAEISQAQTRLTQIDYRLGHVGALLDYGETGMNNDLSRSSSSPSQNGRVRGVRDIAVAILGERNKEPIYYKELAAEVTKRGGILNGASPEATLVSRLVRDPRFVRPFARGFYALRSDYPDARNVGAKT